jgi:hypothetical protein
VRPFGLAALERRDQRGRCWGVGGQSQELAGALHLRLRVEGVKRPRVGSCRLVDGARRLLALSLQLRGFGQRLGAGVTLRLLARLDGAPLALGAGELNALERLLTLGDLPLDLREPGGRGINPGVHRRGMRRDEASKRALRERVGLPDRPAGRALVAIA